MRVQAEERIDASTGAVFRFVGSDHFVNHPRWDPAITEMTPSSAGPVRAGSTARFVRLDGERRTEGEMTVTTYEPDRTFAAVSRFGPFVLRQHVVCEPLPDGATRVLLSIDTRAAGAMGLLLPLFRRGFRRTMAASLRSIKEQVEAGTAPPGATPPGTTT